MNVLILGGTHFLGRHVARALVERGHDVSTFTRGLRAGDVALRLTRFVGERDGDLRALPRDGWDAVVDTSAHWPSWVAASCAHLARARRYLYVSSISVYDATAGEIGDGLGAFVAPAPDAVEGDMEAYGSFKLRSEDVVRAIFGSERALVVRPGLIVGPNDPTDRFTYWVDRGAAGGTILAPGDPSDAVQFVDVRDLAEFFVRLLEDGRAGIYDATGRPGTTTIADVVDACAQHASHVPTIVWADGAWLERHGLDGWTDLPLWIAPKHGMPGFMNARVDRALEAGLSFRPLHETVAATLAWNRANADRTREAGITRERERALLASLVSRREPRATSGTTGVRVSQRDRDRA